MSSPTDPRWQKELDADPITRALYPLMQDDLERLRADANHTPFLDAIFRGLPDRPPPSRYRRLRWKLRVAHERVGDAWRVLRHGLPEQDW